MGTRAAFLLSVLAVSCALVSASSVSHETPAGGEPLTSDVLVLDIGNFTEAIEKYDFLVVEFYAPWCGHCKSLAPEYDKAAATLKSHDPPITLAKVDLNEEENKPLASKFDVQGFPTLKVFRNKGAVVQEYKGPREANGIVAYLKKLSGPSSIELTSADGAKEFLSDNEKELIVIGVFKALDGEEYTNFVKVADNLRSDFLFAHTVDVSIVPDNGVPLKTPSIRLHKDFDDKIVDFTDFSLEALTNFLDTESVPLVTEMSQKPEHRPALVKFFESTKDKIFLFLGSSEGESAALLSSFAKEAKLNKERGLIFLYAEAASSANALQYFGLSEFDLPTYIIQSGKGNKYIAKNVNPDQLAPWIEEFRAGTLEEHIKSEPIPLTNDEPVKVIVANSIKETVLDAGKDVFLEFYAPWCGHCKSLAPILDEVALSFESDPDIMIAKFDATANDVPSGKFDVKGFPTLYFYSAAGVITPFDGDRTEEGIIEFINKNRSKAVKSDENKGTFEILKETITDTSAIKDEL